MLSDEINEIKTLETKFDAFRITIYRSIAVGAIGLVGSGAGFGILLGSYGNRIAETERTQAEIAGVVRLLSESVTRHNEQIMRGMTLDQQREGYGSRLAVLEAAFIRMERNIDWLVTEQRKANGRATE